jgi:hypothetical protein
MHGTRKDVAQNNVGLISQKLSNKHLHLQRKTKMRKENSPHRDCTVATPLRRFNPMTRYDCCIAHTHKLAAEAPDKTSDVCVQKETT